MTDLAGCGTNANNSLLCRQLAHRVRIHCHDPGSIMPPFTLSCNPFCNILHGHSQLAACDLAKHLYERKACLSIAGLGSV